jgi:hypothetical protein
MAKLFIWTGPDCYARARGGVKGAHLEHDATYNVSDFDENTVEEWVATGFAKHVEATSTKKDKEVT